MPSDTPQPKVSKAPVHDHEKSDVPVKWLFVFVVCLFGAGIAIELILSGMLQNLQHTTPIERDPLTQARSLARGSLKPPPNAPRLQLSPPADLNAFRADEDKVLDTYGWVDKTNGIVRIPVARALDLIVKNHLLPVRNTNEIRGAMSPWELEQQRAAQRKPGTRETP
jgi:hypothetical protein